MVAPGGLTREQRLKAQSDIRTTGVQVVGGLGLLLGVVIALQQLQLGGEQVRLGRDQLQQNLEAARETQITEGFTRAIDQLGSDKLNVRLGGIYALERIARESQRDHGPIMEVLAAFVREHSWPAVLPEPEAAPGSDSLVETDEPAWLRVPADIQAAVTVLGRRNLQNEESGAWSPVGRNYSLRLFSAYLRGAILIGAHLESATLRRAHLQGALLMGIHLEGANLMEAHLEGANLRDAHLEGAFFRDAHLEGTRLTGARLAHADLRGARGLTRAQLDAAIADETTRLPRSLVQGGS